MLALATLTQLFYCARVLAALGRVCQHGVEKCFGDICNRPGPAVRKKGAAPVDTEIQEGLAGRAGRLSAEFPPISAA